MMKKKDQSGAGTKREPGKEHNTFMAKAVSTLNSDHPKPKTRLI